MCYTIKLFIRRKFLVPLSIYIYTYTRTYKTSKRNIHLKSSAINRDVFVFCSSQFTPTLDTDIAISGNCTNHKARKLPGQIKQMKKPRARKRSLEDNEVRNKIGTSFIPRFVPLDVEKI